jgi:hypothetical protein
MPITIEYGPAGLAGGLAGLAGQGEANQRSFSQGIQLAELAQRQDELRARVAAENSDRLQRAYAQHVASASMRSPVADHVSDHLLAANQIKQEDQNRTKAQLDSMLEKGLITPKQYQNAITGVLSGSRGLIDRALIPTGQTDPLQKPILQARIQMLRDRRASLYNERKEIHAAQMDPGKRSFITPGRNDAITRELDASYKAEHDLLSEGLTKQTPPSEGTMTVNNQAGISAQVSPGSMAVNGQTTASPQQGLPEAPLGFRYIDPATGKKMIKQKGGFVEEGIATPSDGQSIDYLQKMQQGMRAARTDSNGYYYP